MTRTYDLRIAIVKDWRDPVKLQIEDAKKTEVIENYDSLVYDLTQTSVDSLISGAQIEVEKYRPKLSLESSLFQDKPEVDPNAPVPSVEVSGMTNDGLLTIRFSTPMDVPDLGDLSRS